MGGPKNIYLIFLAPLATPAEKSIGATIRIVQEIWCLLYAGFFSSSCLTILENFRAKLPNLLMHFLGQLYPSYIFNFG